MNKDIVIRSCWLGVVLLCILAGAQVAEFFVRQYFPHSVDKFLIGIHLTTLLLLGVFVLKPIGKMVAESSARRNDIGGLNANAPNVAEQLHGESFESELGRAPRHFRQRFRISCLVLLVVGIWVINPFVKEWLENNVAWRTESVSTATNLVCIVLTGGFLDSIIRLLKSRGQ